MSRRKSKPLAIVIDYDNTLGKFGDLWCRTHNRTHGTCITEYDIKDWNAETMDIKDGQGNRVIGKDFMQTFLDNEEFIYARMFSIDGAKQTLDIAHDYGYMIIIMTARDPKYADVTEFNIRDNDLKYDKLMFEKDKAAAIRSLSKTYNVQMFMDDKTETCVDVHDNTNVNRVFLVESSINKEDEIDDDIERINNIFETAKYLRRLK